MAPIVRGAELQLRVKKTTLIEAAAVTTGWQKLHFYTEGFQPGEGLVDDEELGGDRHNVVDPTLPAKALPNPSGAIMVPLDLNQIGFWLTAMWGNPVTTGASPPYEHKWVSGVTAPGLVHLEFPITGSKFKVADSFTISQMTIPLADEDGFRKVDCQAVGRSVRMLGAAVGAGSPVAALARSKLTASKGLLKINGVNYGNILGGQVVIGNGAFFERYFDDSEWPGAVEIGRPSFQASPEVRYRSDFDHSIFDGVTPFTVEILYQVTADLLLKLECPQVVAESVHPAGNGVGPMSITPTFMGAQKVTATAAPMLTATVRNAIAAY